MDETKDQLVIAARNFVTELFSHETKPELVFHNLEHTEDVVEACSQIAEHYDLTEEDHLVLILAAWFHDTGYLRSEPAGHEEESIRIASDFLRMQQVDESLIQRVASCIEATRMPQSPVNLIEKILCDADLFHLATSDFKGRSQLLKQEQEMLLHRKILKKDWRKNNVAFLKDHKYFTEYGQQELEPKKLQNLQSLKGKNEKDKKPERKTEEVFPYVPQPAVTAPASKEQQKNTERGIQTMFRTTSTNHIRLSAMSDSKAHILISVNAIIISVVLTVSVRSHLPYMEQYIYPLGILLLVCLLTIVFAILATRPSVSGGKFTEEDIRNRTTNLLFFGNFYRMQLEDYQWAMNQMMKDGEYLYDSMIKDIYFLGVVLAKKYRYLRISYTIFMWGLIATVIAFAIATIMALSSPEAAAGTAAPAQTTTPVIDY